MENYTITKAIAEQFAYDWLLVAENDYDSFQSLLATEGEDVATTSDQLREEWENLTADVVELVEENISATAGLFISQILRGQGPMPFDIIARRVLELKAGR